MSDSIKNSHRAVAASALALVLAGGSLATTAVAGEGDKGGSRGQSGSAGSGSQGQSASQRQDGQQTQAQRPTATPSSTRRPTSPPPDHAQGGQPTPHPGQGSPSQGNNGNNGNTGNPGQGGDGGQGADQDPAGNNGTFKVDGLPFDTDTSNEPQIECGPFRLVFFGFDEGQTGDITIAGQAPSGDAVVSKRTGVLISDDAAGGGPNDLDAIVTYELSDLDLSQLTQHPQQGYHLKVTLETDTPGGVKHKVFWIQPPCALPTTTVTPTVTPSVLPTETETVVPSTPPASVGGVRIDRPETPKTPTKVLGVKMTRKDGATVLGRALARGGALAFTGSFTETLLMLAGALLAAGGGFLLWARRPQGKHVA